MPPKRGPDYTSVDRGSRLGTLVDSRQLAVGQRGAVFFSTWGGTVTLGGCRSPFVFEVSIEHPRTP